MEVVGRVAEIWRYPVKSLLGERLDAAEVTERGIDGDRRYALRDASAGTVLSGKRVAQLFSMRAATASHAVTVTFPDGRVLPVGDEAAAAASAVVGRPVEFTDAPPPTRPAMESIGDGSSHDGEPTTFSGMAGTFFDSSPVLLLTDATLAMLSSLEPAASFDARRFRPNLFIETDAPPAFVEESWVGREVAVGAARLVITKACSRCVMTTLPQDELGHERAVLRTVARENDNHTGVLATVVTAGRVRVGDEVRLL